MNHSLRITFTYVALSCAGLLATLAGVAGAAAPGYEALRAARPDGRQLTVTDVVIERDVHRFSFESGTFHFLAPVANRTVGAVFLGHGSYTLTPASERERRHLAAAAGAAADFAVLEDTFETLVLLFVDDTFEELGLHGRAAAGTADPEAATAFDAALAWRSTDFAVQPHLRMLADLENTPGLTSGVFMAFLTGTAFPPALAAVDPRGARALAGTPALGREDTVFAVAGEAPGGIWYLSDRLGELRSGRMAATKAWADALHYDVETEVSAGAELSGTAVVEFRPLAKALKVLPIYLDADLEIHSAASQAADGEWTEVTVLRGAADAGAVVFAAPLAAEGTVRLKLTYSGSGVLEPTGDGGFAVTSGSSWYPNLSLTDDPATFALTYLVPAGHEVVSTGRHRRSSEDGGRAASSWQAELPLRSAGFSYGTYKSWVDNEETKSFTVRAVTHRKAGEVVKKISRAIRGNRSDPAADFGGLDAVAYERGMTRETREVAAGDLDMADFGKTTLGEGLNARRLGSLYFGPLEHGALTVVQQSRWVSGASWPGLVLLPYSSHADAGQRRRLELSGGDDVGELAYHRLAHQWWGHLVGAASYRDEWLIEGLAELTSALLVEHERGLPAYHRHWQQTSARVAMAEAGAMTQGRRLKTAAGEATYRAMVVHKAGFVLHMLRMTMRQSSGDPDAVFKEMMHEFTATYAGKEASTDGFKAIVERHMTPPMNATGNGKMDWFFDQWVHGTAIPSYRHDFRIEKAGGKKYRITGTVAQEGVGDDFRVLLPLYVELKKGEYAQFGAVPMIGTSERPIDVTLELPRKPRSALVNVYSDLLARP